MFEVLFVWIEKEGEEKTITKLWAIVYIELWLMMITSFDIVCTTSGRWGAVEKTTVWITRPTSKTTRIIDPLGSIYWCQLLSIYGKKKSNQIKSNHIYIEYLIHYSSEPIIGWPWLMEEGMTIRPCDSCCRWNCRRCCCCCWIGR